MVSPMSSIPGTSAIMEISRGISRRTSGSPPVSRILLTPSPAATRTKRTISSKVSKALRGKKLTCSGMQYTQRMLQRSVTLIRRLL